MATVIVNLFLAQFAATLPAEVQAVLIWDGAGYDRSDELRCPQNVTLISLPPYSPELNPVENLWHYLRSHLYMPAVGDLFDAAQSAWQASGLAPSRIQTVWRAEYVQTRS